jgi:curli production assembly/transport component CsgG
MLRTLQFTLFLFFALLLASCASLKPYETEPVRHSQQSKVYASLTDIPEPSDKITAAVYRFRDQTGQYEPSQNSISYSTAVTQGATSILRGLCRTL